ncbi:MULTISPECIES: hypothetical protein [Bacillus]|uniref:hypothetical protein n=1 Tax=Bacillus TaxID=1386 RepID=UPI00062DA3F2|nr:hypothetical protein [Bacillus sp. KbaB1]KLA13806.1 hypothetical protein B4078_3492 [Bacillus cereus]OXM00525.1 hypothetical protein B6N65_11325 [Bacillus sp. KbaB1]
MILSEALKKRDALKKKANDIESWLLHQKWTEKAVPWYEVEKAIDNVVGDIYEEYNELDERIEKAIKGIEI